MLQHRVGAWRKAELHAPLINSVGALISHRCARLGQTALARLTEESVGVVAHHHLADLGHLVTAARPLMASQKLRSAPSMSPRLTRSAQSRKRG
jgi:hypothetical protein